MEAEAEASKSELAGEVGRQVNKANRPGKAGKIVRPAGK